MVCVSGVGRTTGSAKHRPGSDGWALSLQSARQEVRQEVRQELTDGVLPQEAQGPHAAKGVQLGLKVSAETPVVKGARVPETTPLLP